MLSHRARSSFASLPANRAARSSSGARAAAAPVVAPLATLEARTSPGGGGTKGRESASFTTCRSGTSRFGSAVVDRSGFRLGSLRRCSVIGDSFFVDLLKFFQIVVALTIHPLMLAVSCGACAHRHWFFSHQLLESGAVVNHSFSPI